MRRVARLLMLLVLVALAGLLGVVAVRNTWPFVRTAASEVSARHKYRLLVAEQSRRFEGFRAAPDPLLAELASGRITAGDRLSDLFRRFPPDRRQDYQAGMWTGATFHRPGGQTIALIGRDGLLRSAEVNDGTFGFPLIPRSPMDTTAFAAAAIPFDAALPLVGTDEGREATGAVAGAAGVLDEQMWGKLARSAIKP